jgi:dihydrofolate reductase
METGGFELIVAVNKESIIGVNNKIPWHIPEDLIRFKKMTENNIIVMGRKTYESLPETNRPLKNRLNIVLTATPEKYQMMHPANLIFTTMKEVFAIIKAHDKNKKVFIIGGSEIYDLFIDYCSIIHVTRVYVTKEFFLKKEKKEELSFFPYSYNYFLCKGFTREKTKEQPMYSKNQNIKFKYITLYKAAAAE